MWRNSRRQKSLMIKLGSISTSSITFLLTFVELGLYSLVSEILREITPFFYAKEIISDNWDIFNERKFTAIDILQSIVVTIP